MNNAIKILLISFFALSFLSVKAQDESPVQPLFNPLILNPAFAGLEREDILKIGNQYLLADSAGSGNLFYTTYDFYSDKLKGGMAFYFQQALQGKNNISSTEFGMAYSGFPLHTNNGIIRFGLNTNFSLATKQLSLYLLDQIIANDFNEPNLPGEQLFQYAMIKPRVSFLWDLPSLIWGLSLGSYVKMNLSETTSSARQFPLNASLYLAKRSEGFQKGLHALPFVLNPEFMVYYQEDYFLSRLNIYAEFTRNTLGVFLQGDFSYQQYSLGGILGLANENLRLNFAAGANYSAPTQIIGFTGEISLILKVTQFDYTKLNPWQPN